MTDKYHDILYDEQLFSPSRLQITQWPPLLFRFGSRCSMMMVVMTMSKMDNDDERDTLIPNYK